MVFGKKVAIFDWEWGRNSAPRGGQKNPCLSNIHLFRQTAQLVMSCTAYPGAMSIPAQSHTILEFDHEVISTVILLLQLIQEG